MGEQHESSFREVKKPVFDSRIPGHLTDRLSPQEKWLVETLSKLEQSAEWSVEQHVETNREARDLDTRAIRLEHWQSSLTGKNVVLKVISLLVGSALLGALFKILGEYLVSRMP